MPCKGDGRAGVSNGSAAREDTFTRRREGEMSVRVWACANSTAAPRASAARDVRLHLVLIEGRAEHNVERRRDELDLDGQVV